jgi:excisionase family DNA binding protein
MEYYNTKEAAEYLRVNVRTIHEWYRKGKIKGSKPGGKIILFTKEQLDAILKSKEGSRNWFSKIFSGKNKKHIDAQTA